MMIIDKRITRLLGVLALGGLGGCLDLEEEIVSGITATYFETAAGLEDAVDGAYSALRGFYGRESSMMLGTVGTDIFQTTSDNDSRYFNDYTPALDAGAGIVLSAWNNLYAAINSANTVISRAPTVEMNEAVKTQRIAEARFLRAMLYFDLVRNFGDVPLLLEETRGVTTEGTRAPVADVYKAIIDDLTFAEATLPVTQVDGGRATKGATQHLLSLVYLTRAAPGDMDRALDVAKKVIDSGRYRLLPTFAAVFDENNQHNEEVIFSVQYTTDPLTNGSGNNWHLFWIPAYDTRPGMTRSVEYGRPHRRARVTNFLLGLWDREKDSRYDASFQTVWFVNRPQGNLRLGDTAIYMPGVEVPQSVQATKRYETWTPSEYDERMYPGLIKQRDTKRASFNETAGTRDLVLFRLGETYLLAAEAAIRAGRPAEAVPFMNAVRRRAAQPGQQLALDVTPAQMNIDFLLDERARELAGEGKRWHDLVRMGKLVERVQLHNRDAAQNIKPHHVLRPIPQAQIDLTSTPFPQNPGY